MAARGSLRASTEHVLPLSPPSTPSPASTRRPHHRLRTLRIDVPDELKVSDGGSPSIISSKKKSLRRGTRMDLQETLRQDAPPSPKPNRHALARGTTVDIGSQNRQSQLQKKHTRMLDGSRFSTSELDRDPNVFVNPNEVILESDDEDIDDEEEDDSWSAAQRIIESGRMSFREAPAFADKLRDLDVFVEATLECIVGALREARCKEGKASEILWSRTAHDSPELLGVLQLVCPVCMILKGRVKVSKRSQPKGEILFGGDVLSAASADVECLMAVDDCILLVAEVDDVRDVCTSIKKARDAVMTELRKTRPPSMWPDELLQKLVLVLRDLPFFEDLELSAVKRLARLVRYRACIQGEPLPPPKKAQTEHSSATIPDDNGDSSGLVVCLGGSAVIYTEVSPPHERTTPVAGPGSDEEGRQSRMSRRTVASVDFSRQDTEDSEQPAEEVAVVKATPTAEVRHSNPIAPRKRYMRAVQKVKLGSVLGQGEVVEPHGASKSDQIVRCESPCEIIMLSRSDYLKCMSDQQLELQQIVHALRNVPPSLPGEPHHRSDEQLTRLSKMIEHQPEFKDFPRSTLMQIVGAATFLQAAPGHILCREGSIGDRFFAVIEGKVGVHKLADESAHKSLTGVLASLSKNADDEGDGNVKSKPNMFKTIALHRKTAIATEAFQSSMKSKSTVSFSSVAEKDDEEDDESVLENGTLHKGVPPSEPASPSKTPAFPATPSPQSSKLFKRMVASAKAGGAEQLGRQLCRLRAGSAFGAMTLLKKEPRTASCKTLEPTKLFVVLRDHYVALCAAKEEAAEREAIEFFRHHLITQEHLKGLSAGSRAAEAVITAIHQRLNQSAKHITRCTLERGTVLVDLGELSKHVWLLRHGTLALCSPPTQASQPSAGSFPGNPVQRLPTRLRRGISAATSASRLITSPGEVIGASHEVLGIAEPSSVRVESATCELYKISWEELKKVFKERDLKAMLHHKLLQRQGQRGGQNESPKDLMASAAAECRKAQMPSSEQQSVLHAVADAFDAVLRFQDGAGPGNGADALAAADAAAKGPAALGLRPGRGPLGSHTGRRQDRACQGEIKDKFEARLKKAMTALEKATENVNAELCDVTQKIQIGNRERPVLPRPPPVTSAAHLRSQILQLLKNDTSEEMKRFITGVILDPQKGDLEKWVKKYLFGDHLKEHAELQSLHLLKRRSELLEPSK